MSETVFGSYTQAELNDQYDTSKQLPDAGVARYFDAFAAASARARETFAHDRDVAYGPHERERFDFFAPAQAAGAPLLVWVHGGYWRRLSKDDFSYVAAPFVPAGAAVAVLNYPLAPAATLDEIVDAVRRGFSAAVAHAAARGVDVRRTFVGGHSVGAQLAATVAARHVVAGVLAISGLYDLEPIRRSYINEWIALDAAGALRHGPIHLPPRAPAPLIASVGGAEQAEFRRQQREYVAAWRAWGGAAREIDAPNDNHFTIVLDLQRAQNPLVRALLELMSLQA